MNYYKNIAELYVDSSISKAPVQQDFDILLFEEFTSETKKMMPPHRRGLFTIIFLKDQKGGQISINENLHTSLTNALLFQGMEHVFSFVRDENIEGGVILFQKSLLLPYVKNPDEEFPFFSVTNQNLFHLSTREQHTFEQIFRLIYKERQNIHVVKPLLLALLVKSKELYDLYASEEKFLSNKMRTARKYKNLVNNSFIENREVSFYAEKLHVSSNYLNEIIKSETGISAKRHISERVLLEAKNLLLYSEMDVAEISYVLQFSEPTHFTKFFKKETGVTPKHFKQQQL